MLDVPFASRDLSFNGLGAPERDSLFPRPRHLMLAPPRMNPREHSVKRVIDIVCGGIGFVFLLLFAPVLMLAIRLESRGPILFQQQRIGLDGAMFTLFKFRTMTHDTGDGSLRQATRDDPRVTRVGRWLRRCSIDELPQLFNVLRGDMSIVGPRPHAPGTRAGGRLFEDVTHRYGARHCVKPGMTGLAQIRGWRGETDTEEKLLHRIECDLEYIATWSPLLDLAIIWRTAGSVIRMRNAH